MAIKSDKENLENALSNIGSSDESIDNNGLELGSFTNKNEGNESSFTNVSEEIGFHKGSLNTLLAERNEIFKMIGNVEAIMQAHIKRLEELGVKIDIKPRDE